MRGLATARPGFESPPPLRPGGPHPSVRCGGAAPFRDRSPGVRLAALPVLVSTALGGLLPKAVRLLPHEATLSFLRMPADPATALSPGTGLLVLTAWASISVTTAWLLVTRRDA